MKTPGRRPKPRAQKPQQGGTDWRLLLVAAIVYAALYGATAYFFAEVPPPLPPSADRLQFAEGRAMQHLHQLAEVIGHRQVSTAGEELAAQYLLAEVQKIAADAAAHRPDLAAEAARESVSGAITMHAFKFEIANVYSNLTNVVLRITPTDPAAAGKKAVLVNSHYDSVLGTVGASDAASCICVMLEMARTIVANPAIRLHAPVVFLFNGGEETLSQASNGFFTQSRFAQGLGAFINLESTGPWGPDVVFQHTGDWTLLAYARSAPRPRGTTLAQDFFDLGLIPADTDYRMFSYRHYGNLPGIDIAFIFDGTAYHTVRDEVARIRPGTLQNMGQNVLAAIREYTRVLATDPAPPQAGASTGSVYFDLWGRAMVVYTHAQAKALHHAPLAILLLLPLLTGGGGSTGGGGGLLLTWINLAGSTLLAAASVVCSILFPIAVGAGRAILSGTPMAWYGRPPVAYAIYLPAAVAGLLLPHVLLPPRGGRGGAAARSVGFALLFALICSAMTSIGMHSSFFFGIWAYFAAAAAALLAGGGGGGSSWGGAAALLAVHVVPVGVALPSAVTFMAHIMEKVGLAGAAPGLLGLAIADIAVGAVAGAATMLAFGSLTPQLAAALGRRRGRWLTAALLAASLAAAVWASAVYRQPYSRDHPKRLLLQHIHQQGADGTALHSKLSLVGLDSFALTPLLPPSFLQQPAAGFDISDWEAFYPLNYLVSDGVSRAAPGPEAGAAPPTLRLLKRQALQPGASSSSDGGSSSQQQPLERLLLELDTAKPAWGVMNISGEVVRWSFTDKVAQTEMAAGGAFSHMVRFAGNMYALRHAFWLDVPAGGNVSIQLYVMHVEESAAAGELLGKLPEWASPVAVVTWQSQYQF